MNIKKIEKLALDYSNKRAAWEAIGMMNTYGISVKARNELNCSYAIAEAEKNLAWRLLEEAKYEKDNI